MSEVTFEMWMGAVNRILEGRVGLGASDLVDVPYYDMFEGGASSAEAAVEALIESGSPQELIDSIEVAV